MSQISKQEEANAGIAKWKNTNKQHLNLQWQEDSGSRISDRKGEEVSPIEEEEFILKMGRKKGWTREKSQEKWNQHLGENWDRDHSGEDGGIRLWLPKKEYKIKEKDTYMDQRASTTSEIIKNASASDVYALTMHVHAKTKALNFQHSFFSGGAGTPYASMAERASEGVDMEGVVEDCDEDADESKCVEPPVKKLKGQIIKLRASFHGIMDKTSEKAISSNWWD